MQSAEWLYTSIFLFSPAHDEIRQHSTVANTIFSCPTPRSLPKKPGQFLTSLFVAGVGVWEGRAGRRHGNIVCNLTLISEDNCLNKRCDLMGSDPLQSNLWYHVVVGLRLSSLVAKESMNSRQNFPIQDLTKPVPAQLLR